MNKLNCVVKPVATFQPVHQGEIDANVKRTTNQSNKRRFGPLPNREIFELVKK